MASCLEIITSRNIFQNTARLRSITSFKFTGIIKLFTNTIKVMYLEINNEKAFICLNTTFKVA